MLNVEWKGEVLHLELNRPEVRNAFDDRMIAALTEEIKGAEGRARVILVSGAGRTFCAGGDLNWMKATASNSFDENRQDALRLATLLRLMVDSSSIVVSAVQGSVFGGGCGLVCASDYTVASEDAQFCFSEARLGLVPAVISPHVLAKIGASQTRALFTTAIVFGADRAERIGLVHEVAPRERLLERAWEIVKAVLNNGPTAAAKSKQVAMSSPMADEESAALLAERRASQEGQEGMSAFLEKRKPSWVRSEP